MTLMIHLVHADI